MGTAPRDRTASRTLVLGALGVVYGDIGTSPLYALRESLAARQVTVDTTNVLGILSLITWSLIIVVSIKYLVFVLRADRGGEGGILALTGLVLDHPGRAGHTRRALVLGGVFGTALLYGDGMITPAISVLSAIEGVAIVTTTLEPVIVPLSCGILVALFAAQHRGTGAVGAVFGPVMMVWFTTLALLGVGGIVRAPGVLVAINPAYAVGFLGTNGATGVLVLGSVFLVVTGAEALYADMSHFGRRPIRVAWFVLVFPALLCNYYGQGALLLSRPAAIDNPFYRLAPTWGLPVLVVLSTMATVIASQALISGAFTLTAQAVQMGYLPRLRVDHTSDTQIGQVYIPAVNWTLMAACVGLVVAFRTSGALAAAYGVAVATTMVVTTLLFARVARDRFGWSHARVAAAAGCFLVVDLAFVTANAFKIPQGGWLPLAVGVLISTVMTTWQRGRRELVAQLRTDALPLNGFVERLAGATRVPGTIVYLTAVGGHIPSALLTSLRHTNAVSETVLLVHVDVSTVAHVAASARTQVVQRDHGLVEVTLHYGFRDRIDVARVLRTDVAAQLHRDLDDVDYVLRRDHVIGTTADRRLASWRAKLLALLLRNAGDPAQYFGLPGDRVIEISAPVAL